MQNKRQPKKDGPLLFILLFACVGYSVVICLAAGTVQVFREDRQEAEATLAVDYPWLVYPISEGSKQALCSALSLPSKHAMCRADREVMFGETFYALDEVFPAERTSFRQVEERLGRFPHIKEVTYDQYGNMNSFRYVFRLTEYKGACTVFQISLEDLETVERIYGSHYDSMGGAGPTECWGPREEEEIHPLLITPDLHATESYDH